MVNGVKNSEWTLTTAQRQTFFKYASLSLPRHTSYPSVPHWKSDLSTTAFRDELNGLIDAPVSLYVHVPFCESLCHYCACNRTIQPKSPKAAENVAQYLRMIKEEITTTLAGFHKPFKVAQLHLGGGTPTYLNEAELEQLLEIFSPYITWEKDAERAIEIDPRVTTSGHLKKLRSLGFNRVSLGIQDFNPTVQKAIHRHQPYEMVRDFVTECRSLGFSSINFDLIYGLPMQTLASVEDTIARAISLNPDRIAFYRLALIPEVFRWQRSFQAHEVPDGDHILDMFLGGIRQFSASNYDYIGLDHFAKPSEMLHQALRDRTLRRSFQGMTTGAELPVIGFGPSAISSLPRLFAQRPTDWLAWREQKQAGQHDFVKALTRSDDDIRRAWVLEQLYCFRSIDKEDFARRFHQNFDEYFQSSRKARVELEADGILTETPTAVTLTEPLGALLTRVAAAVFDAYIPEDAYRRGIPTNQASRVG